MAERILRSPGVTTRELDLSAPGRVRPQGIPAGIIGTSEKGPAFVPVTFATLNDFSNLFGATKGKHFGAMAVNEWMRNARSGLYLRVLGVGDGNTSSSTYPNQVANAGFKIGQDMRDKDRTAASKALSTNGYAAQETDGSGDNPVRNPYAGSSVTDPISVTVKTAGSKVVAGASQKTTVTISPAGGFDKDNYDGIYFIFETSNGTADTPTLTKYLYYLTSQAVGAAGDGARNIDVSDAANPKIRDGFQVLATFDTATYGVAAGNIHFVDISGDANEKEVLQALAVTIEANSGNNLECYTDDLATGTNPNGSSDLTMTVENASGSGPGTPRKGDVAATVVASSISGVNAATYFPTVAEAQAGVTEITGENTVFTVTLEASNKPIVGATVVATDAAGTATTTTYVASGAGANQLNVDAINAGNASAVALRDALHAISNMSASAVSGTTFDLTVTKGTSQVPTLAVDNNNPSAPEGRVFFLGVDSYSTSVTNHPSDYLGSAIAAGSATPILRGVLMFPSGVMPGIVGSSDITTANIPDAAYGEYGAGKNLGVDTGKGKVFEDSGEFRIVLNGFTNTANYTSNKVLSGSFDTLSPIYFPKVFNTDPTKIQERGHYLHAHYDVPNGLAQWHYGNDKCYLKAGNYFNGFSSNVHASGGDYRPTFEDFQQRFQHAFSPWIMSQRLGNASKKLFRFHALDAGASAHGQFKISIANIAKSTDRSSDYGTFDVQIRDANDTDLKPIVLQTFSGLSLNPSSDRYIARVIGDQNTFYDFDKPEGKQKLVTEGLYPNSSQYVRVEVVSQIEAGQMEASALPMGFNGKHHLVIDGKALAPEQGTSTHLTTFKEPPLPFRTSVSVGKESTKVVDSRFYWGCQWQTIKDTTVRNQETGVLSLIDNLTKWYPQIGAHPAWVGDNKGSTDANSTLDADAYQNNAFSLENIWIKTKPNSSGAVDLSQPVDATMWSEAVYIRDGNTDGEVYNSSSTHFKDASGNDKDAAAGYRYLDVAKDFSSTASKKFYKFTLPMQGGFDGLDIFDQDKAEMNTMSSFREMDPGSSALLGGPAGSTTAAFRKGLDILAEKSDVDVQLLATPGLRTAGITDYAIDKTEERFDALYIMDMPSYDHSQNLVTTSAQETSVNYTSQKLADRNLDTSFAAAYFPDLVIKDGDNNVVAPPSVAVLGALSLNDKVAHPWYAPAGFARGALASTIETAVKLNRTNMDTLYETDINPITSFPQTGESVIVFGQKTLLQSQSALDRVNVRRLLIDVRRKVRTVANQILFEPNRESTLARFSSLVNPILGRIQQQQGLDRYKVVIDTTTTTQQDVENNTIRGKIFLQPTRSIEFISLDFVVTNAGAEI